MVLLPSAVVALSYRAVYACVIVGMHSSTHHVGDQPRGFHIPLSRIPNTQVLQNRGYGDRRFVAFAEFLFQSFGSRHFALGGCDIPCIECRFGCSISLVSLLLYGFWSTLARRGELVEVRYEQFPPEILMMVSLYVESCSRRILAAVSK